MTLDQILNDEALRLQEFPVARDSIFLAHAGDCPLPSCVAQAIADYARQSTLGDQEAPVFPGLLDQTRTSAARLLGCDADEVSLVGPTSLSLSLLASGLKLRRHDNILIYFDDYPSNVYPWLALAERGIEVRLMNTRGLGLIRPRDVMGQIDENTRLVALASCHFISGFRLELEAIGTFLRSRGILFCVDGIQTLGAFPTLVEHVDMLAADAHKWLLGPCGAGLLYVRRDLQDRITPPVYGWHNVRCPDYVAQERIEYAPGPGKFEAGSHNLMGLVGLRRSLDLILELGVDNIAKELLRKRAVLLQGLQALGYTVLMADVPKENASAIISCFRPDSDMAVLHTRLTDAKVITSLRRDRSGQAYLRFSPHFYNTDAELAQLLKVLQPT
jgi:selenocysteine lyase/cysteine desulfurase